MPPTQVGLIGFGFAGQVFHAPVIAAVPDLQLRAIVTSRTELVRRAFPDVASVVQADELLAEPAIELVVIATPNTSHFALAQAALAAGKHVVVDKPFTITTADADALISLAGQQGRLLSVFHNRRWDSDFRTIRQIIAADLLGAVMTYEAHYDRYRPEVQARWREQPLPGSGILFDLGSHLLDQALQLFGPPDSLSADLGQQRPGAQAVDYFHLILHYPSHRAILHGSSLVRQPPFHFAVHGARGTFIKHGLDPQEDALIAGQRPGGSDWGVEAAEIAGHLTTEVGNLTLEGRVTSLSGDYAAYYRGMAAAIRHGAPLPVTAAEAYQVIALIELAQASHAQGRVLPYIG